MSQYGPYRAYRVATPDGEQHTFFHPRSLFPELDRLQIRRGSKLQVRATERISPDGRVIPRIELMGSVEVAADSVPEPMPTIGRQRSGTQDSVLACVALKAAVQGREMLERREDVLAIADTYLAWLKRQSS
ncbi:MAG: hypothetical protein IPN03_18525 [Holophagales bacterium]|nr:hypothetical protein [Holophagales bacterium]